MAWIPTPAVAKAVTTFLRWKQNQVAEMNVELCYVAEYNIIL
jgi:hypothetical protein